MTTYLTMPNSCVTHVKDVIKSIYVLRHQVAAVAQGSCENLRNVAVRWNVVNFTPDYEPPNSLAPKVSN